MNTDCGFGDFYNFIIDNNIQLKNYTGVDIFPEFIQAAKKKYPNGNFAVRNIYDEQFNESEFDYIFASGIFSIPHQDWDLHFISTIDLFLYYSRFKIGFNLLVREKRIEYPLYYSTIETINSILNCYSARYNYNSSNNILTVFINKKEM